MCKRLVLFTAVAFGFVAGSGTLFAADWISVHSADGQFTALFPTQPKEITRDTKAGPLTLTAHAYAENADGGISYTIMWNDFPPQLVSNPEKVLDDIAKGYNVPGRKILSDIPMKIGGKLGRMLEVDLGNGVIHRTRLVLVGARLYQLMADSPVAKKDDPDLLKFLDGFSLWPVQDFPTRGFRIEGAESTAWRQIGGTAMTNAAQWISSDSKPPQDIHAMITIDASLGSGKTAEENAQNVASTYSGKVSTDKLLLDGETAFRVDAVNTTKTLTPVEVILAIHNGFLYMILGSAVSGNPASDQIDQIVKGWKWEKIVAPPEHLDALTEPQMVFGNLVAVTVPKDMIANPTKSPDHELNLGLYNMADNSVPFQAFIQLAPIPKDGSFASMKANFLPLMNTKKLYDDPLSWTSRNKDETKLVTGSSHSASLTASIKHDAYLKWGLIKIDDEHMVLINFTIVPANDRDKASYEAAADKIVDSIQRLAAATQPAGN